MSGVDNILVTLSQAYPRQKMQRDTIDVYAKALSDIPPRVLERAADNIIKDSKWFPSVAELRAEAKRVANLPNARDFRSVSVESAHQLLGEREGLYTAFYVDRALDEEAWNALADKFERMERPHRAEHTRKTLADLKAIVEGERETV
jgi:hypothetical protein